MLEQLKVIFEVVSAVVGVKMVMVMEVAVTIAVSLVANVWNGEHTVMREGRRKQAWWLIRLVVVVVAPLSSRSPFMSSERSLTTCN